MDQLYLLLLGAAFLFMTVSLAALGFAKFAKSVWTMRASRGLAIVCLVLDFASFMVHLVSAHRPGSELAMAPMAFLGAHPSFLVIAALAGLVVAVSVVSD